MYSLSRDNLAQMIAAHTSGIEDAIAESDDYILADNAIDYINLMIESL